MYVRNFRSRKMSIISRNILDLDRLAKFQEGAVVGLCDWAAGLDATSGASVHAVCWGLRRVVGR